MPYTSPAAAFSGTLEQALLRREAKAHQDLMDQHNIRMDEANLEFRKQEAADRKQSRDAIEIDRQATLHEKADAAQQATYAKQVGNMQKGDVFTPEMAQGAIKTGNTDDFAPQEPQQFADDAGNVTQGTTPLAGVMQDTPTAQDLVAARVPMKYIGSNAQRKDAAQQAAQDAYIKTLPPDSPAAQAYGAERVGLKTPPSTFAPPKPIKDATPIKVQFRDPKTGKNVEKWVTPEEAKGMGVLDSPTPASVIVQNMPPRASNEGDIEDLAPKALDMEARAVALGGPIPAFGMGDKSKRLKVRVVNRAAQFDVAQNKFIEDGSGETPDIIAGKANISADTSALTQAQKNASAVRMFSNTAKRNGALLDGMLSQIPDYGVSWANKPARELAEAFGSTAMKDFAILRQSVQVEYARTINNPSLTGVLSDSARKEIEPGLAPNATMAQLRSAIRTLAKEAANRETSIGEEIGVIKGRLKNTPSGGPAAPAGGAAAGAGAGAGKSRYQRYLESQQQPQGKP